MVAGPISRSRPCGRLRSWQYWTTGRAIDESIRRGMDYLAATQQSDGSWRPRWFASPCSPGEGNAIYGTSQVILAYRDLDQIENRPAKGGLAWLAAAVDPGGGWGGARNEPRGASTIEETAMAVEALWPRRTIRAGSPRWRAACNGSSCAVEESRHREPAAIGLFPPRLLFAEKVYPLAFTVSALGQAVKLFSRPA